jgi:hypothetical protein
MTALIPKFVNHADNDGDWSGQTSIPLWDAAAMIALCDVTTRINAPANSIKAAAWCYQQYQMLNLMRWIKHQLVNYNTSQARSGMSGNYADALTAYNAASWATNNVSNLTSTYTTNLGSPPGTFKQIFNRRKSFTITGVSIGFQAAIDFYLMLSKPTTLSEYSSSDGYARDTYFKPFSYAEQDVSSNINTDTVELGVAPDTSSTSGTGCVLLLTSTDQKMVVLKIDGANGFTFKDW